MRQTGNSELLGTSRIMADLKAAVTRVAQSDAHVLIAGETGTGKEVVARAINAASTRATLPFVMVNCAGLPDTLLESELFGYVKGSFDGAHRDKPGKLQEANTGTIFLDEFGEMTIRMQGLLLRFLETGEIRKVGAERGEVAEDVQVIAATNRNLRSLIAQGLFREDLFYRLDVMHIVVPPLRERREDIPMLIDRFVKVFAARNGNRHRFVVRGISPAAVDALCAYPWPGNVRELENVVKRLVVTGGREIIDVDDLGPEVRTPLQSGGPRGERRRTVADELYTRLVEGHESFWTAVYPLYVKHEITRSHVRDLLHKALEESRGQYKIVLRLFNIESTDYKRFLNFLRKHDCRLPFQNYR